MQLNKCYNCMKDFDIEIDYICPHCGYNQYEQEEDVSKQQALKPGTILYGKYYIGRVLGIGGCAITYVSYNYANKSKVAIKEFFPSGLVTREPNSTNIDYGYGENAEQFKMGFEQFEKESRQLARVGNHQGIVDIFETFSENNTAYIAMEFVEGITLADNLTGNGVMDYKELLRIIIPICESLHKLHINDNIIHRDIAPDNIMLQPSGRAKLIDFGASLKNTQVNENIILKHGYAPVEQYDVDDMCTEKTDVYAMCAVIYHLLTGKRPPRSDERKEALDNGQADPLLSFGQLGFGDKIPAELSDVVMKGLSIEPDDRIADMAALASRLYKFADISRQPIEEEKKSVLKPVLAATIPLAVILIFVVAFFLRPSDEKEVDYGKIIDLSGKTLQQAQQMVSELNSESDIEFKVIEGDTYKTDVEENSGTIATQNPKAEHVITEDEATKEGGITITVRVYEYDEDADSSSDRKVEVPNLANKTEAQCKKLLDNSGFTNYKFESAGYNNNIPAGSSVEQSVEAGEKVVADTEIIIYLSAGPRPTTTAAPRTTKRATVTKAPANTTRKQAPATQAPTQPPTKAPTQPPTQAPAQNVIPNDAEWAEIA